MTPSSPIIVLDSGLGGLTVARTLRAKLPHEPILYFGDTARLPYGGKSAATVITFVRQIIDYLRWHDPKHVVIACNTATALALPSLRRHFPGLPFSGVIEPGARAAAMAAANSHPRIGVLATEATVRSGAYPRAIRRRLPAAQVFVQAAPLLAPIIEDGRPDDDPLTLLALNEYLAPFRRRRIDVLLLGCTHYPILQNRIQRLLGIATPVIDSAEQCAEDVARRLRVAAMLCPPGSARAQMRCFVTDQAPRFASLAARFLGSAIGPPVRVSLDELDRLRRPEDLRLRLPA